MNFNSESSRYIEKRVKQIGHEIGEFCPYWFDGEIFYSIQHENKDQQDMLRKKYFNQCHEPVVEFRPNIDELFVTCRFCDMKTRRKCSTIFPEIAKRFRQEFEEYDKRFLSSI